MGWVTVKERKGRERGDGRREARSGEGGQEHQAAVWNRLCAPSLHVDSSCVRQPSAMW